jgi:hypothetical protein
VNATEVRQIYETLQLGERVEVVHRVQLGSRATESRTTGTLIRQARSELGADGGQRRWWDEKQWCDQLLLRQDDGELTTVTLDEYTVLRRQP